MKVLVTGGTGLLGAKVGEKLLENGMEPILFDVAPRIEQIEKIKDKVEVIRGDILEFPELLKAVKEKKIEAIIHTAGILTAGAIERPYTAIRINIDGTANVLEAARIEGIQKLIFCSSATVYDFSVLRDRSVTESHPISPKSIYASTKLACEYVGNNYANLYGIKFVTLRFASLYGPGSSQSGVAGLWLHPLLSAMAAGKSYSIKRPSRKVNEYIYASDAASALVSALQKETTSALFNIGEGKLRGFDEIIGQVRNLFPGQNIEVTESAGKDTQYTERAFPYNISLAEKELGFKVEFPLDKALSDYAQWLKDHLKK